MVYDPNQANQGPPIFDPAAQIGSILDDPRGRAAALSFGINMLQPQAWGDNFFSQLGRSVGSAGEGVAREESLGQKQELADAKTQALEARAGRAGASADLARERLGIAQTAEEGKRERAMLQGRIRLSNLYQNYVKDVNTRNAKGASDPLRTGPFTPEVPVDMGTWIKNNPTLRDLGLIPSGGDTTGGDTGAAPDTAGASPSGGPEVGSVHKGYRFNGGDPSKASSWSKV